MVNSQVEAVNKISEIVTDKKMHTFEEQMAIECIKKINNPFRMLGVKTVMKDLKVCKTVAYSIFKSEDFPSKKVGKNYQVCLVAYLMWKVKKDL